MAVDKRPSLALLGAATMLAPMAVSVHVPMLPSIGRALTGDAHGAEVTVSVFLWTFAAAMLFVGPLSDRFGRRPVLAASLVIYAVGSLVAALASSLGGLLIARGLQALGAAALVIVPRAIVRDVFDETTSPMSRLATLQSTAPAFAPLLGGVLGESLGWRAPFAALVVAAIALGVVGRGLPETRRLAVGSARAASPARWGRLVLATLTGAASSAVYFALLPVAPEVLSVFGRGPQVVGVVLLCVALGFVGGAAFTPWLVRLQGRAAAMATAAALLLGGLLLAVLSEATLGVGLGLLSYALATGALLPLSVTEGLDAVPAYAGRAASILGAVQLGAGAAAASLVSAGVGFGLVACVAAAMTALSAFAMCARSSIDDRCRQLQSAGHSLQRDGMVK
jgi:DHA1 family bicyclomycin/chloramphenicol resistance-like MFS transporter